MENSDNSTELLENVVISDVATPQYMIQRIPENSQLLTTELLQHPNGLVVDLGGADFIPVNYTTDTILPHDLTEEDRNLAAALVAVQLNQQQKQQQQQQNLQQTLTRLEQQNSTLDAKLLQEEQQQQIVLTDKETTGNNYIQIVGTDHMYVEKHELPKTTTTIEENLENTTNIKIEDDKRGSDGENRPDIRTTSKKSLPHKKRISRKLKKQSNQNRQYFCNLCEQTFLTNNEFIQHEVLCQTTITPIHTTTATMFSCQLCTLTFEDQLKFFEHLKSHYEPPSTSATPQETTTRVVLSSSPSPPTITTSNNNNNTVINNEQQLDKIETDDKDNIFSTLLNLTCLQCNKTFRKQKIFETHMREVHQKQELDEFSEPEDLMEGINVVVDAANEVNSDSDTKAWYHEDELQQTEEDLKELEAEEHVCHICKQPFPLRAILLQHLVTCRTDTGNIEPPAPAVIRKKNKKKGALSCTECDRVFTHRNSLVYHMRGHSGIRPHQCEQCGKSFFASSALKVHLRLHSGDKPYNCSECGKNFRQWGDLKYHMTSIHSTEKQFQCEYCGKDFARKYSLIVHRRIHTGEKNYKCEFCGKTFRASSYLQNHRRIHTGEKPHECDICHKPFRVRSDMKRHQKTHTKRLLIGKTVRLTAAPQQQQSVKNVKSESNSNMSEDVYELNVEENNETEQILTYDQEQLDATVRDGGTLYSHGHQLFLVSYSTDVPVRTVESSSTWIQTGS